jgi:hypothetical protein
MSYLSVFKVIIPNIDPKGNKNNYKIIGTDLSKYVFAFVLINNLSNQEQKIFLPIKW